MSPDNKMDQFVKEHFQTLFPDKNEDGMRLVYHYTTLDTLRTITQKDADFLCTYCAAMNDKAEFSTGLKVLENHINTNRKLANGLTIKDIKDLAMNSSFVPWSMSFSTNGDSLNQWIAYTDEHEGGAAIGFDIDDLYARIKQKKDNRLIVYLAPCLYERTHEKEISSLFSFLFGEYKQHLCSIARTKLPDKPERTIQQCVSFWVAFIFASIVKDESFSLEHEWRLVVHPLDPVTFRNCSFIGGKPRISSGLYGRDYALADSIKQIVCSPHGGAIEKIKVITKIRQLTVDPVSSLSTYTTV